MPGELIATRPASCSRLHLWWHSCSYPAGAVVLAAPSPWPRCSGEAFSAGSHSSPPMRWATSCRMVVVRCWYRAAIAVLDHPITPITVSSATPSCPPTTQMSGQPCPLSINATMPTRGSAGPGPARRAARPERLARRHHYSEVCAASVVDAIERRSRRVWVPYPVWLVSMCWMGINSRPGGMDQEPAAGSQLVADGRQVRAGAS